VVHEEKLAFGRKQRPEEHRTVDNAWVNFVQKPNGSYYTYVIKICAFLNM